ncbi:unnamed protein product, partial [Closterium sp. NIES-53]
RKIGDIPEERRHRLLDLLKPHHITLMWDAAGNRFQLEQEDGEEGADPVTSAGGMLPDVATSAPLQPEIWDGRTFFVGTDGLRYGRVISGGPLFTGLSNTITPLYFRIRAAAHVLATDEPCDLSFDYESGQLHLKDSGLPEGFPDPRPHPPIFDDDFRDYVRAAGPGVIVGQSWQEGREVDAEPRQFLGEFILIRRHPHQVDV